MTRTHGAAPSPDTRRWLVLDGYRSELLRAAYRHGASRHDAEDAVSEALLSVWRREDVDAESALPYLMTTVKNAVRSARRQAVRRWPKDVAASEWWRHASGADEVVCDQAEDHWVLQRLDELTPRQRRALELKAEGRSGRDIAAAMQTTESAIEGLLVKARRSARAWVTATLTAIGLLLHRPGRAVVGAPLVAATAAVTLFALVPQTGHHAPPDAAPSTVGVQAAGGRAVAAQPPELARAHPTSDALPADAAAQDVDTGVPYLLPVPDAPRQHAAVGPVGVDGGGTSTANESESFPETVLRCLERGVVASPTYVGCAQAGTGTHTSGVVATG